MTYNGPIDNPYNPDNEDHVQENLPLDEVFRLAIQSEIMKIRVNLPCKIIKVNSAQNVDIQPLFKTRYIDGEVVDYPPIQQVPVSFPMGKDWSIKVPIAVGDYGYASFCDRDLDSFLAGSGEISEPATSRSHNISDAIFTPGLVPFSQQVKDTTTDLVVTNGKGVFRVQKSGKFIATNGTNELMDLLVKISEQLKLLSETLSTDTTNTIFGPMKLNAFATYNSISSEVNSIKNKLTTIKGE